MFEASLCGADSNLVDLGRYRGARELVLGVAPVRECVLGLPVEKVCGVFTGAAGVKPGASLVDRIHMNMGTATALLLSAASRGRGMDRCIAR